MINLDEYLWAENFDIKYKQPYQSKHVWCSPKYFPSGPYYDGDFVQKYKKETGLDIGVYYDESTEYLYLTSDRDDKG